MILKKWKECVLSIFSLLSGNHLIFIITELLTKLGQILLRAWREQHQHVKQTVKLRASLLPLFLLLLFVLLPVL